MYDPSKHSAFSLQIPPINTYPSKHVSQTDPSALQELQFSKLLLRQDWHSTPLKKFSNPHSVQVVPAKSHSVQPEKASSHVKHSGSS